MYVSYFLRIITQQRAFFILFLIRQKEFLLSEEKWKTIILHHNKKLKLEEIFNVDERMFFLKSNTCTCGLILKIARMCWKARAKNLNSIFGTRYNWSKVIFFWAVGGEYFTLLCPEHYVSSSVTYFSPVRKWRKPNGNWTVIWDALKRLWRSSNAEKAKFLRYATTSMP